MTYSLTLEGVTKTYDLAGSAGKKHAVEDVSFHVAEGERVGIIGRNGAGKTTLLRMIAGVTTPTAGRLNANGKVTALLTLGIGLREDLSGLENIRVDGEIMGRTARETEALTPSIVEFADLGDFIKLPVRTYSTGMKARLAFSMLVHVDPEILIIDEALSVGDAKFSSKASAKMRELTRRGRILLFVSHSMNAICEMCTRCIWIDGGKVRMDGAPTEVTAAYLNEVRATDEASLLRRFRRELVDERLVDGWAIDQILFRGERSGQELAVPQTGERLMLDVTIHGEVGARFGAVMEIIRLDGLLVCRSRSAADAFAIDESGAARVVADLGPLPLSQGIFSARIIVVGVDSRPAARRSALFEVINPHPHRGGRPILVVPVDLSIAGVQ